jgi:hypothetical protein
MIRQSILIVAVITMLGFASAAHADTFQVSYTGSGLNGILNLTTTAKGGGVYQVTSLSGSQNGVPVTGLVPATAASGYTNYYVPNGDYFYFDNLIAPNSNPVFDVGGLLFDLLGSSTPENLYYNGGYIVSNYVPGFSYPQDFSIKYVKLSVVPTPELPALPLFLVGAALLGGLVYKKSLSA